MPTRDRQVYLLDPQKLSPEVIAVTFAKTSRSPQSFRDIASELTDENSAEFHEKWVVGYGHSSVAEHAVLHIAAENVSRLVVENLESNRLASYTEKSTRYQKWDSDSFYIPDEFQNTALLEPYRRTCTLLFDTYRQSLDAVRQVITAENPRLPDETEAAWERRNRSAYVDVCRYLLPASSLANVGVTINARALEHAIRKLLSSPLLEAQSLGREIKSVAVAEVPTLVKYADEVPYWRAIGQSFSKILSERSEPDHEWCRLIDFDPQSEERVLAALLIRYSNNGYAQAVSYLRQMPASDRQNLVRRLSADCSKHDTPPRELEYMSFNFELIMDQGAYFEFKRHRMMTQTPQALTTQLGYAVPRAMVAAGMEKAYRSAMQAVIELYPRLAEISPSAASYIVPNAFNRRVLINMNLRSAIHFLNLRCAPNAHFAIRRIARRMADEILQQARGLAAPFIHEIGEDWHTLERDYFTDTGL